MLMLAFPDPLGFHNGSFQLTTNTPPLSRSTPMNWPMVWSMQHSCFCSKMPFDCLQPTTRASSTSWVKMSLNITTGLQIYPLDWNGHYRHRVCDQRTPEWIPADLAAFIPSFAFSFDLKDVVENGLFPSPHRWTKGFLELQTSLY